MLPFSVTFATPWLLVGLVFLVIPFWRVSAKRAWLWRALALACLIIALAGPSIDRPSHDVAVVVDVSDSVGGNALSALESFDFSELPADPNVIYFGAEATTSELGEAPPGFLDTSQTDIAIALQVAAASGAERLLLVSDGAQSVGDARLSLPPIPVDTYHISAQSNARLVDLLAPEQVSPGQTVEVIAIIESDQEAEVVLQPTVQGEALAPIRQTVPAGRTPLSFSFTAEEGADIGVSANLTVDFAQPTRDDSQETRIAVSERDPVLVVGDPAMANLLETQGFAVLRGEAVDITTPLDYSAIILRSSARQFTPGQLTLLADYVKSGGGLMMTGGPDSFGLGAWYRTPVEEVLPVNTDLRTDVELPLVAMVIVLDRSQSMAGGNPRKIELAKEGAISVVDLAYSEDRLGLIVFSNQAEWAFELRQATERGKREMLQAILAIETQGGTVLEPAYREAVEALQASNASIKHIIILSDGQLSDGGPFGEGGSVDFTVLAELARAQDITTSTIAIGDSADFTRMEAIAQAGGGRYYAALNVSTLPQIFTNEALTAARSLLREETLNPTLVRHPLIPANVSNVPALEAYIASSLKAGGEMLLEGQEDEPILAVGRQGLGRAAALTTDLNAWAGAFGRWGELPALLGTVTRWLQARPAEYSATVTPADNKLKVVVDAVRDGEYINNEGLKARYNGVTARLEQVAPGRYEGFVVSPPSGGTLVVTSGGDIVARSEVSAPSGEFDSEGGEQLMQELARLSGGEVLSKTGVYDPATPPDATPIWPWFALAGFGIFMLELVIRRFSPQRAGRPIPAGD